jgi:hypothetical protein
MAGYSGKSMSNNAVEAYSEGKKPISNITKEDIQKYGVSGSLSFFKWFIKNYCDSEEWHHTSPKYNETVFYDIEKCCNNMKKMNIDNLKAKYKSQKRPKSTEDADNNLYYARIEYSISTYSGRRKYINDYAIIYKCWAYIKDDYKKEVIRKKINGSHFRISEKFQGRPEGMQEETANAILSRINEITKSI